jgi:hypothetical protein
MRNRARCARHRARFGLRYEAARIRRSALWRAQRATQGPAPSGRFHSSLAVLATERLAPPSDAISSDAGPSFGSPRSDAIIASSPDPPHVRSVDELVVFFIRPPTNLTDIGDRWSYSAMTGYHVATRGGVRKQQGQGWLLWLLRLPVAKQAGLLSISTQVPCLPYN